MEARARTLAVALLALVALAGVGLALTGGVGVDGTVTIDDDNGPEVTVDTGGGEMLLDGPSSEGSVEVVHDNGEATISGPAGSSISVDSADLTGSWTRTSSIDTNGGELTIDPADKPAATVGGSITALEFRAAALDDGTSDAIVTGSGDLTLRDLNASTDIVAVDASGNVVDQTTSDSSGTATISISSGGTTEISLVTSEAPVLDEASASPSAGTVVSETPVQLSISVSDTDFGTIQGDNVDITFYDASDDSTIGTETLSSNATATANMSDVEGGENSWYVTAEDEYNNTVTSETFTYNAPSEIEVRNEENPDQVLTDVDVTIEFYQSSGNPNNIETVEVTNGTADMTGLPAGESFIAVAKADGYTNRRIFVDSLIETQEIYLVKESSDVVNVEYELDDFSGRFAQSNSILIVERNINGDWTPIQGDFFGSTGRFEATLIRDTRHRMRIVNIQTGAERDLGTVTPQSSGVKTVTISVEGSIRIDEQFEQINAEPAVGSIQAAGDAVFGVRIREGDQEIGSWSIEVQYMDENGSETLATREGSGTSTEEFVLDLRDRSGGTVVANVDYETGDSSGTVTLSRSIREYYPSADGLLGGLITVGDGLGADNGDSSGASMMAAMLISLLVTAGLARVSPSAETVGIGALGSVIAFGVIGWLPMGVIFAATVGFGATIVLRRGI